VAGILIQMLASVLKASLSFIAIFGETAARSFSTLDKVDQATPSPLATSVTDKPSGSLQVYLIISPG